MLTNRSVVAACSTTPGTLPILRSRRTRRLRGEYSDKRRLC
jgi:hypothetical protein